MTTPRSADPERAFAGALLLRSSEDCRRLTDLVKPTDFADVEVRFVVDVIRRLAKQGKVIDATTVLAEARRNGGLSAERMQSFANFVTGLGCDHPLWAEFYLQPVVEESVRRSVHKSSQRLLQASVVESIESMAALVVKEFEALRVECARLTAVESVMT